VGRRDAEPRGLDYAEVSADGVPAMWLVPHGADLDRAIVTLHGGGFVGGSLYTHRKMYGQLAKAAGVRVLLATYRFAPEFRYPAQIEDAVTAFRRGGVVPRRALRRGGADCRRGRDRRHYALRGSEAGGNLRTKALS
jgi:hypothetical protein